MNNEYQSTKTHNARQIETVDDVRQGRRVKGMPSVLAISTISVMLIFVAILVVTIR